MITAYFHVYCKYRELIYPLPPCNISLTSYTLLIKTQRRNFRCESCAVAWAKMDSNHRRRKPADLQSAPFGHSGNHPTFFSFEPLVGFEPTTPRLQITCSGQLS